MIRTRPFKALTIALAAVALFLTILVGGSTAAPTKQFRLGVLFPGDAPYLAGYKRGLLSQAKKRGVTLLIVNAGWKADVQANQMTDLLAQKPDGIIVWAVDAKAIVPVLARASLSKIPMVASNSAIDPSGNKYIRAYTGPNDITQGGEAAKLLAKALGGKGNVLIIQGQPGTGAEINRTAGFVNTLKKIAPTIKVLARQPANWDKATAINVTRSLLTKYGAKVNGIFGEDDTTAVGAAVAVKQAGLKSIKIVGLGGSKDGLAAVCHGTLTASMVQSPIFDGEYAVNAIVNVLQGKPQPAKQYLKIIPVTKANACTLKPEW